MEHRNTANRTRWHELRLHMGQMVCFYCPLVGEQFLFRDVKEGTVEERSLEKSLGKVGPCALEPSLQAPCRPVELPRMVFFHPSLHLPEYGRKTHRGCTFWRQDAFLGISVDGGEAFW